MSHLTWPDASPLLRFRLGSQKTTTSPQSDMFEKPRRACPFATPTSGGSKNGPQNSSRMVKLNLSFLVVPLLLLGTTVGANAATASGPNALALAALVADHSPALTVAQKHQMAWLLDGYVARIPSGAGPISVNADSVTCRASNVDISSRGCTLTMGTTTISLKGRLANELFATIGEAGVHAQGAAGTMWIGLTHLACTISPQAIRRRDGSGATCSYQPR